MSHRWKVVIVGSGPSGSATALALAQHAPSLARETLLLERAAHSRPKLCGGGVTTLADEHLRALGVWPEVPAQPIRRMRFEVEGRGLLLERNDPPLFRVVDRRLFDAALVAAAQARGATLHENEPVRRVTVLGDGVRVETDAGSYEAEVLVAADGAKSTVRRQLVPEEPSRISRLMEVLTPESPTHPLFEEECALFDFNGVIAGVQGYAWNFPSLRDGQTVMNRGIFDGRVLPDAPRADLKQALGRFMAAEHSLDESHLMGHPERWFHPEATLSLPRVLFVGEAAGIEPFAGEGISFALGYGRLAGATLAGAFRRGDFDFREYAEAVRRGPLGREMNRRRLTAAVLYRLRSLRVWQIGFRASGPLLDRVLSDVRVTVI